MNNEHFLVKRITELYPDQLVRSLENEVIVEWVCIFSPTEKKTVGLSTLGEWVVKTDKGITVLQHTKSFRATLTLLEQDRIKVEGLLASRSTELGDIIQLNELFPYTETIRYGLISGMSYWAIFALDWLAKGSESEVRELKDTLVDVYLRSGATQKIRHSAKRQLARIDYFKNSAKR